ncbi:MAG: hypothetical protein IJ716_13570 [Lachnospiraceae bacterium]|nr:hypothetical protein [Lachnospiraceae bacterium]
MAKKTIVDEVFGKITYKEGYWKAADPVVMTIAGRRQEAKLEIVSFSTAYDKIQLGITKKEVAALLLNTNAVNEAEVLKKKDMQRKLYKDIVIDNLKALETNIENAAVQELSEVLQDYDERSLSKFIGKEKAIKLLSAKTVEEKLESLQLLKIFVFMDCIEIECKCDWYKYGGGFIIIEGGECIMRPIDCLSI